MTHKQLGFIGLLYGPSLGVGMYLEFIHHPLASTWFGKIWGLLYISGWLASIEGLRRLNATGSTRFGRIMLRVVMITLVLANVYNVWELIDPTSTSPLYFLVDMCWPLSNVLMAGVGVAVLRANRLQGWRRWIPLTMSLWLPLSLLLSRLYGYNSPILFSMGIYSAITWSLLGLAVMTTPADEAYAPVIVTED